MCCISFDPEEDGLVVAGSIILGNAPVEDPSDRQYPQKRDIGPGSFLNIRGDERWIEIIILL